jgi:molybdopterin-guanine dinucleotide biosynthesis protein A
MATDTGVIVAGGRSTRFGEADKAVAELAGTPMIRRVADRIAEVVDTVVINCRADQTEAIRAAMEGSPLTVRIAEDEDPDEGPMAGIRTGLRAAPSEYAFVVACDMPFVEPPVVEYLLDRAAGRADGASPCDAAVPQLDEGWYQTTHAAYRAAAMAAACDAALARDEHKILAPLEDLDWTAANEAEIRDYGSLDTFENVNTREELAAAEERLA